MASINENINDQEKVFVDKQKVDMFIMSNQKYFPSDKIVFLREKLYKMDEGAFAMVGAVELKDPTTMLIISHFLGSLGVDRFMIKETGAGVLKLLTGGCCGILTLIDWFSIQKKTKELNFKNLMLLL